MDHSLLDIAWILICAAFVFLMQAGFMCLEAGLTRSKNNINVAIKNLTDTSISILLFWAFGFTLMFGQSTWGWIGTGDWLPALNETNNGWSSAFFLFQAMFCATAATIFSGAVAERMSFHGYILLTFIISGLVYPIYGHWTWNSDASGLAGGWLRMQGFVDFAGATTVHCVGGWFALAALLVIGPRRGRFPKNKPPARITASNLPLSVLGVILLWVGWFGFNGGSRFTFGIEIATIIVNTVLGGSAGGLTALVIGWSYKKRAEVSLLINGSLAGLVAITASCHIISPRSAILIGSIGAIVMLIVEHLLERLRIDDAVGAVPIHLGSGIWGTLSVALFGRMHYEGGGYVWLDQLVTQILGISVCAIWSFGLGYILIRSANRFMPLRVSAKQERIGLNVSEHGTTTELLDLLITMDAHARTGDLSLRVPVEPFTQVGQIAERYNRVMTALEKAVNRTKAVVRDLRDGIITFTQEGLLSNFNPGAEKIFGYAAREILGQSALTILAPLGPVNKVGFKALLADSSSQANRSEKTRELLGIRKDNSTFPVELTITKGEVNNEVVYTGLIRDVTDRKHAETLAGEYRRQLERERENLKKAHDALQTRVKELSEARQATLNILHDHDEMRKKTEAAEKRFRSLSSFAPVGIFEVDVDGHCIYTNPRWETITGLSYADSAGDGWLQFIHEDSRIEFLKGWKPVAATEYGFSKEFRLNVDVGDDGAQRWVRSLITALRTGDGKVTGYVGTLEEITESKHSESLIRASLEEKELLLREIHHRVKNNLQVISSLLNIQSSYIADESMHQIFKESQSRIKSMALIHEKLYSSKDLSKIKFDDYLRNLANHLFHTYRIDAHSIDVKINVDQDIFLGIDTAIPCGLIVNELISNSMKYAFPDKRKGEIQVGLCSSTNGKYTLTVRDNGIGVPADLDINTTESLGMQLVTTLTSQLEGTIVLDRTQGTSFDITFCEVKYRERVSVVK